MTNNILKIVAQGPDWLTLTSADKERTIGLWAVWKDYLERQKATGIEISSWNWLGYKGWTHNGVSYGVRGDEEAALITTGASAMKINASRLDPEVRCTRIDLQVTAQLKRPNRSLAELLYNKLQNLNANRTRQKYYKLLRSNRGDTLYVNKRSGALMIRLYDKSFDYGYSEPGHAWRWEVEYKKEHALAVYKQMQKVENVHDWTIRRVNTDCRARGVPTGWFPGAAADAIEVKVKASSANSKLSWLVRCVRPVVLELEQAGMLEEAQAALYGVRTDVLHKERQNGSR